MSDHDDTDYGVERTRSGDVEIRLGEVMPFEIPAESAIRLAALLCKKAGCEVLFRQGSMKIRFPTGFAFGDASSEIATKPN